ncbi:MULTISPECIES: hypothetical protein [unclassified Tolypothrix]|uniref:hypothetical protein n=1 Tax=unclassified Tolypothrix TaxID=2649714 RepID=UPI0005EABDA3|nr:MULTISPECIES: hypothetical protein [unclassified Tolypothrix]BAY89234.1 hypothetical protein NIES3275_12370 [Microchaete diplosiphon NIES-3275]EKE97860.1 hypothetical protein FDUTEX481_04666 [Tolypothrix sp. PCC 7601]MBE9082235.1 hypothetical protein [Tolypothrix sp. LEGE 11397]UYD23525.1 hypothetical protein HGR01_18550 [Tolypothrix sp. PCC 7712]UYD34247.1 hypothetical protein HG267_36220 [Tolypothrix sp. PCC 7601]
MLDIPTPVIAYLLTFIIEELSLAYLLVKKDGCLSAWGGKLAAYGVSNLQAGEHITEQVFFLEGLLPLDDFPLFLPRMKTEYGICADVHLFPSKEGDWILMLDATRDESHKSLVQQQANEFSLLQEKLIKIFQQESNQN